MKRAARVTAAVGRAMQPVARALQPTPERVEQASGVKLLRSMGWRVYVSGTVRRRGDHPGTMQTPGIPDVEAFTPVRNGQRQVWKWECKAKGGRLRPEQAEYRELCQQTGTVVHVVGPLNALIQELVVRGFLKPEQVGHYHLEHSR